MFYKFKPFDGPSRFTFKDPDTGSTFEEKTKLELIRRIAVYRQQNNLEPIEHISYVLESYWCTLPENEGKCVPATLDRGFLGYLKGGIALVKQMLYKKFATQEVADKRSEQCSLCRYNVFPDKGVFLKWSEDVAVASVEGRRSKKHTELGMCDVCTCPLKAKVWWSGSIKIEDGWVAPMKEVDCWQLKLKA